MKYILLVLLALSLTGSLLLFLITKERSNIKTNFKAGLSKQSSTPSGITTPSPKVAVDNINNSVNTDSSEYFLHRDITATVFWVGEESGPDNDYIANDKSFWDRNWMENYGGYDDPEDRDGYYPAEFIPKQNPFYLALPYADTEARKIKENAHSIPWYDEKEQGKPLLKNRWVKVVNNANVCYGQWEDVGPFETNDIDYVFGKSEPTNQFGKGAGIDLSPALRDCLGMRNSGIVDWQFVEFSKVPEGPWRKIISIN